MPVILITGGTGLIGKNLTHHLTRKGYEVIIVSRNPPHLSDNPMVSYAAWNIDEQKIDSDAIAKADYIINLAGAGVMDKRWTKKYKTEILTSRTKSSELIIKGLKENANNVKAVIAASAIGFYGIDAKMVNERMPFTESDHASTGFLGDTCTRWENSINPVTQLDKRLVTVRIGIVLSKEGGAFPEFKKPLRFGIAAIFGGGKQVISWIHIDDLCRLFIRTIEDENLSGIYNAVSPSPISNKDLVLKTAKLVRGQFYIPVHVPEFLLKLILGERSIEILKSTTVSGEKIKAASHPGDPAGQGFTFLYPTIDAALQELVGRSASTDLQS